MIPAGSALYAVLWVESVANESALVLLMAISGILKVWSYLSVHNFVPLCLMESVW